MPQPTKETIPGLLVKSLTRELVLAVEEALIVGAQRAYAASKGMHDGHLPSAVGQQRHFHMNESFYKALAAAGAVPTPIRGNSVVTGRSNIFTLARFNIPEGIWINSRRSKTRQQMSFANRSLEPLVQPELFGEFEPPAEAVAFFAACFSGSMHVQPESPTAIQIAVPDREMRGWLFREHVSDFVKRFDQASSDQRDLAKPVLKKSLRKGQDKDGTSQ